MSKLSGGLVTSVLCLITAVLPAQAEGPMSTKNVHSFALRTIDGETKSLADYKGKTLLVVNTASRCGFTGQYKSLEELYGRYKDRGFEVLAFPANDFLNQEPGTDAEIKEFCSLKYRTTFPVFSKISVKGKNADPLYVWLTTESGHNGPIKWNFNKFLVDPSGNVVARYDSQIDPLSPKLIADLERSLLQSA